MFPPRSRCALVAVLLTLSAPASAAPAPTSPRPQDYIAAVTAVLHGMVDLFPQVNNDHAFRHLERAFHNTLFLLDNHPKGHGKGKGNDNGAIARGMRPDRANNVQQQGALGKGMVQAKHANAGKNAGKKDKGAVGALAGKKGGQQQKGGQQAQKGKAGNIGALAGRKNNAQKTNAQAKAQPKIQPKAQAKAPANKTQGKAQLVNPLPKQAAAKKANNFVNAKNNAGRAANVNVQAKAVGPAVRGGQGQCAKNQNQAGRGAQQFVAFNPGARQMAGQVGARAPQKNHARKK